MMTNSVSWILAIFSQEAKEKVSGKIVALLQIESDPNRGSTELYKASLLGYSGGWPCDGDADGSWSAGDEDQQPETE